MDYVAQLRAVLKSNGTEAGVGETSYSVRASTAMRRLELREGALPRPDSSPVPHISYVLENLDVDKYESPNARPGPQKKKGGRGSLQARPLPGNLDRVLDQNTLNEIVEENDVSRIVERVARDPGIPVRMPMSQRLAKWRQERGKRTSRDPFGAS